MAKKTREKKSPMGGGASRRGGAEAAKPKHSMSTDNRTKGSVHGNSQRSAATVRRLKMYKQRPIRDKKGKIINITSVVGHTGNLGQANYTASKAGIVAMSKSLAIEYAKKNINVNCISPGFIKTAMTDKIDEKFKETIISKIPSARLGEPDDIANAVVFLCSSQSNYINGETLHVNGGMYMA